MSLRMNDEVWCGAWSMLNLRFSSCLLSVCPLCRWAFGDSGKAELGKGVHSSPRLPPFLALFCVAKAMETYLRDHPRLPANGLFMLPAQVQQIVSGLDRAEMQLHDTPCLKVKIGKTMRRRPDLDAIVDLAAQLRQWAASEDVMVFIEQPRPQPINGSISCYSSGLLFGTWCGVMRASGFRVLPVEPTVWKRDLELCHADKERSRALALELFPRMADMLRRKKDHGRAEAMLLAAWGACSHARQMAQGSPVDENGAAREAQR
uniref:Uncharacterized protein n=1 Tax=Tetraselmis sp. GSL018 TaxID=582737 RepID=A0A061R3F1_9CHLO|mmetsp:Transcript_42909/g.101879  ORF Transcript_42909/g.101879 Transcript_42909/m.101879 type:complete len:262 (+) Transcript_42909:93-878(+)